MSRTPAPDALRSDEFVPLAALLMSRAARATSPMLPALFSGLGVGQTPSAALRPEASHADQPAPVDLRMSREHLRSHLRHDHRSTRILGLPAFGVVEYDLSGK